LLNALAGAELAIVSAIAGTTRDKIAQTIQIEGVPLHVIDTAGLRDSSDEIEQMGVARAWGEIDTADVVLFLHDLTRGQPRASQPDAGAVSTPYQRADAAIAQALAQRLAPAVPVIDVWNKCDAVSAANDLATADNQVLLSAKTGDGIDDLRRMLLALAGWNAVPEGVYMARERHVQALQRVAHHVAEALSQVAAPAPLLDLVAEELRLAQNALGEITGAFGADDLLGVIFSRFCIGK
jgi:tRNA modification GTPase